MAPLRGGIIGLGRMGITHLSILKSHPDVRIVGICDNSKFVIRAMRATEKGSDIIICSSYEEMINKSSLDFVVIATPTKFHSEIINFAIKKNLHVFVEKPFVMYVEEGKKILGSLEGKSLVNQVGYVYRFNDIIAQVKNILTDEIIGSIKYFKVELNSNTIIRKQKLGWRGTPKFGGGCLLEFGSHCIDLAVYLVGVPTRVMGSAFQNVYSSHVEDIVFSTLVYDNNCYGNVFVNWSDSSYRRPTLNIVILGEKGKIIADSHCLKIFSSEPDEKHKLKKGWNTKYITDFAKGVRIYVRGNEFTTQLDYFINCIKNKTMKNLSSFEEALKTDIIIEKIRNNSFDNVR